MAVPPNDIERIVVLQRWFLCTRIDCLVFALLQHRKFVLQVYALEQQGVVDHLRAQILQGLRRQSCYVAVTDDEPVLEGNPELELSAAAYHVEQLVSQDRQKSDHPQRGGLPGQDVTMDFLIIRDLAPFAAADGSCNADGSLQRLNLGGLGVDSLHQVVTARRLTPRRAQTEGNWAGPEQTATQWSNGDE